MMLFWECDRNQQWEEKHHEQHAKNEHAIYGVKLSKVSHSSKKRKDVK